MCCAVYVADEILPSALLITMAPPGCMYLAAVQFVRPIACPARHPTGLLRAYQRLTAGHVNDPKRHLTNLHCRCSPAWKRITPNARPGPIGCPTASLPSCGHVRVLLIKIQSLQQKLANALPFTQIGSTRPDRGPREPRGQQHPSTQTICM